MDPGYEHGRTRVAIPGFEGGPVVTGPDAETDLGEGDQGQECAQSDQRSSHSRPVALAQSFFSGTDQALAAGAEHAGVEASKGGDAETRLC